ncbi:uncharacterized protein LOC133815447 [Humulus lupulus]|uniref:uncharacterized protein LOC133815447 n=1 Tax=Humulus lupulus TaxID=3486 RepID=UPI002B4173D8|nr:uncharacterized protein LOC133815447 [Humulus lupulus]
MEEWELCGEIKKSTRKFYYVSARPIFMVRKKPLQEENVDPIPPPQPAQRVVREEEELDTQIEANKALEPMEEVEEVCIDDTDQTKGIRVRGNLNSKVRAAIIARLKENQDVLAWSHSNMTGIDALNIDENTTPVRQKRRPLGAERAYALKLEVENFSSINFIRKALYPVWLANLVLVPKPNGTWRTCIDFTDLNKACLKDCFPLPRIDQMVDAT